MGQPLRVFHFLDPRAALPKAISPELSSSMVRPDLSNQNQSKTWVGLVEILDKAARFM